MIKTRYCIISRTPQIKQHFLITGLYKWLSQTICNCFALWVAYNSPHGSFNFPQAVLSLPSNSPDAHGLAMNNTLHYLATTNMILLQELGLQGCDTVLLGKRILKFQKDTATSTSRTLGRWRHYVLSKHQKPCIQWQSNKSQKPWLLRNNSMRTLRDPPSLHSPHITLQLICKVSININPSKQSPNW
jgi:hypothetical protein